MKSNHFEVLAERLIFGNRKMVLVIMTLITMFLGYQALNLKAVAGFEKMIPTQHPYIQNYFQHQDDVPSGNTLQIAVAPTKGDIFDASYLEALRQISDEAFLLPGVDRAAMMSLWTKNVQWRAVTEEGFEGGIVIPDEYDGSPESIAQVRANVLRSGTVGQLVANNFNSSILHLPLLETNPETGEALDYYELSQRLEGIRTKYANQDLNVHIVGFAKLVGDLIAGITSVAAFFALACALTFLLLYIYLRCMRGTLLPIICSVIAVVWQLGLLNLLGLGLDPFSILIPFLVFAIGVSHGVQIVNAVAIESVGNVDSESTARFAFRDLFTAGLTALISDAVGFITLLFIQIRVIQELGMGASVGVAAIIATNLILLPVLLSFWGISKSGISHATKKENDTDRFANILGKCVQPRPARLILIVAAILIALGLYGSQFLEIGDLEKGSPELRANSPYNQDVAHIVENYSTSSDILVVMIESGEYECVLYQSLDLMDKLQWKLSHVNGVQSTDAVTNRAKQTSVLLNEGNLKWYAFPRDQHTIFSNVNQLPEGTYFNQDCNFAMIYVALDDHKAETLQRVTREIEEFATANNQDNFKFLLAAGGAGIAAATNQEIEQAQTVMLVAIYAIVILMVFLTFRSRAAVLCIVIPLVVTSILAQALMAYLGIGIKVATLPVIALGVGIGVDYGIYIYNRLSEYLQQGLTLELAYINTIKTTGRAVLFTGITLAIGVFTWLFSPIKFQADMGIMLMFMFLWNMIGALTLAPALACYLLPKSPSESSDVVNATTG